MRETTQRRVAIRIGNEGRNSKERKIWLWRPKLLIKRWAIKAETIEKSAIKVETIEKISNFGMAIKNQQLRLKSKRRPAIKA